MLVLAFFVSTSVAKTPKELWYVSNPLVTDDLHVEFEDPVANEGEFKVAVNLHNKSDHYLVVDVSQITSDGIAPKDSKVKVLEPGKKKSVTLNYLGDHRTPTHTLQLGGMRHVTTDGKAVATPAFSLPGDNSVETDHLRCTVKKSKQTTQKTSTTFVCDAKQEMLLRPGEITAVIQHKDTGETMKFANGSDQGTKLALPGDTEKMGLELEIEGRILDMQFAPIPLDFNTVFEVPTVTPFTVDAVTLTGK